MKQYYVYHNGQQIGPISWNELMRRGYPPDTLVWSEGMANWQALKTIMPQAPPPHYGNQQVNVNVGYANQLYPDFGIRLVAYIIDLIIFYIINFLIGGLIRIMLAFIFKDMLIYNPIAFWVINALINTIIFILYFALFESSELQATPGKMIFKIKVVDGNHDRMDIGRSFGRALGKILSTIILGIGFFMALWTNNNQTLHDQLTNTYVIKADNPQSNF